MVAPTKYLPTVAWRTTVSSVILLTSSTYRLTVSAIDINEDGAGQKEIGFFLKDFVGHTYSIIAVSTNTIDIEDDFGVGVGPQTSQQAVIYKSVFSGRSPYLAPIYYRHLDKSARDYSSRLELDILYSNDPNAKEVAFNTDTPILDNYQTLYAEDYGELPKIQLFTIDSSGNRVERSEKPYFIMSGGLVSQITFGTLADGVQTGFIVISK